MENNRKEQYRNLLDNYSEIVAKELTACNKFQEQTRRGISDCLGNTILCLKKDNLSDNDFANMLNIINGVISDLNNLELESLELQKVSETSLCSNMSEDGLGKINHFKDFFTHNKANKI